MRPRKEVFGALMDLCWKQRWLQDYGPQLTELFDRFCKNDQERRLLFDLLHRFTFLDSKARKQMWKGMARRIVEECGLDEAKTQVVALTVDTQPDSGQWVLQMLKAPLAERGWRDVRMVNRIGSSVAALRHQSDVVLVDEFVGSGDTVLKRVRDFSMEYDKRIAAGAASTYSIRVFVLAGMEAARRRIEAEGVRIRAERWLTRGITQHYRRKELRRACRHMLRMESRLEQRDPRCFPFGYGRAEALYASDEGNAVNSVFPVFWSDRLQRGEKRAPLFVRREDSA